ncbi:hypothetical protein IB260_00295 [Pseudomonas sp. PDM23]|uniref:hypothetical protein n=1 Tax=unclassified Pseudomonas TaxID=196821 RepID=UPI00177D1263|nr:MULTISPECIES: hypothetical protein [unclassified Pseudomonas]MBD9573734.1 hypothetical protein [Pseudomonas sp. PDM23]MBD9671570.1 hypothetical protein [Pseudomonas sp. PDM21]
MSYRVPLAGNDDSEDAILRLPPEARTALIKLIANMAPDDLLRFGLSWDEIRALEAVRESLT